MGTLWHNLSYCGMCVLWFCVVWYTIWYTILYYQSDMMHKIVIKFDDTSRMTLSVKPGMNQSGAKWKRWVTMCLFISLSHTDLLILSVQYIIYTLSAHSSTQTVPFSEVLVIYFVFNQLSFVYYSLAEVTLIFFLLFIMSLGQLPWGSVNIVWKKVSHPALAELPSLSHRESTEPRQYVNVRC